MTAPAPNTAQAWTAALRCPAPDVAHFELRTHLNRVEDALVAVVALGQIADAAGDTDLVAHAGAAETALVRIGDALDRVRRLLIQEEARRG